MGQMTADQYLDQIQNQLMKTLTEKKDAMPPGFNQQRFALNCITVIRDMMKDYKKREQLQTVDINSIVLCMIKGAYLGLDFLNGECYAIPYKGEMTFQTDYKGEIKVCKRFSDDPIKDIYAKVVREGDMFLSGYKFTSKAARKGVLDELRSKKFQLDDNGTFLGAKEFMDSLMGDEDYKGAFVTENKDGGAGSGAEGGNGGSGAGAGGQGGNPPRFSAGANGGTPAGGNQNPFLNMGFNRLRQPKEN